ncbi:MAG TPA: cytochrome c biogenesis protein CcsA [Candidatus Binatia bacterium]|jgi:ABC-type transport system involved in cytochrome c biogenesis permease subunit|nr:cytochrome c biogenesis protein CcsA [Candidatus Binatia bacterium]
MKVILKLIPWCFVALFATEIVAVFAPKKDTEFHVREFGRLPVVMNGRVQPFDSVGRNTLLQLRSTGDVPLEEVPSWKFWHHPKKIKSSEWMLEVLFKPDLADTRPVFLIHHPDLLAELNLGDKGVEKSGLRYYTFDQLKPVLDEIEKQGAQARLVDEKLRSAFQKQAVKLHYAVFLYQMMKAAGRPPTWDNFEQDLNDFEKSIPAGVEAVRARDAGRKFDQAAFDRFWTPVSELFTLAKDPNAGQTYPLIVPPTRADQKHEEWASIGAALLDSVRAQEIPPPIKSFAAMGTAYAAGRAGDFNAAVAHYKQWLAQDFSPELKKGRLEFFFNDTKCFLHAMIIYLFAFILAAVSLLTLAALPRFAETLRQSAFYLIVLAGLVHTFGLVFRMYLEGRPPVTNLYSSAIFIGWGAMVLGLALERVYRLGLGSAVASFAGFVTLIIAHNLALGGDTMEMMRAVLDTNFWLATHVVTVTLGYASTFVAGLLAIAYIFLGLWTPLLKVPAGKADLGKALSKMVYAIVCFATLFSFVGTVLGGIWADQSWGRFWGWDPKENGALLIVLWNALILHARWGGLVRDRGLANLAVFGNIVTSFSWFGVNMLGIGLHSYGFMDAAATWLKIFIGSQLLIIVLGLLPLHLWRSFRKSVPVPPGLPGTPAPATS